jgi:hypothetical protein
MNQKTAEPDLTIKYEGKNSETYVVSHCNAKKNENRNTYLDWIPWLQSAIIRNFEKKLLSSTPFFHFFDV